MKYVLVTIALAYLLALFPAFRTSIAFYLYKDKDKTAYKAMKNGFFWGFISIWLIYPIYLIKDCFLSNR